MTENLLEAIKALIDGLDEDTRPKLRGFVAVLYHEMRTNVTSIEGFSNLLSEGKEGQLSESQKMMLHRIQKRAEKIREILDESLTKIMGLKGEY